MKYVKVGRSNCSDKLLTISVYLNSLANEEKKKVTEEALRSQIESEWGCHEIALIDNGSEDDTFSFLLDIVKSYDLAKMGKRVHLIRLPKNVGFARANNIAYFALRDVVKPKYVGVVNDDLIVYPKAFKYLIKALEADERIGGVQGLVWGLYTNDPDSGPLFWHTLDVPGTVVNAAKVIPKLALKPLAVSYLDGAFSIYKEKAIREVGFFETFAFLYGDDTILGMKLWKRGYVLLYVPVLVGRHARGGTRKLLRMVSVFTYWGSYTNACLSLKCLTRVEGVIQFLISFLAVPSLLIKNLLFTELGEGAVDPRGVATSLLKCPRLEGNPQWLRISPKGVQDFILILTRRLYGKTGRWEERIRSELERLL